MVMLLATAARPEKQQGDSGNGKEAWARGSDGDSTTLVEAKVSTNSVATQGTR